MAPSLKIIELMGHTPAALLSLIEEQPGSYRHLFRGQSDASWNLIPALYRSTELNLGAKHWEEKYDLWEQQSLKLFFDEGLPYLPPLERNYSNDRILAQHFGVATRLLDWSKDPLVATFFAVEDWKSELDAALFMILPDAHYRPEEVRSLGPHTAISLRPPAIDRRIPAQKSVFTFHPYGPSEAPFVPLDLRDDIGNHITIPGGTTRGFVKIVIPKRAKVHLHQTLSGMGIDRRNLFPGLEGVGATITARARSGQLFA